jgi:hypothetical protein
LHPPTTSDAGKSFSNVAGTVEFVCQQELMIAKPDRMGLEQKNPKYMIEPIRWYYGLNVFAYHKNGFRDLDAPFSGLQHISSSKFADVWSVRVRYSTFEIRYV